MVAVSNSEAGAWRDVAALSERVLGLAGLDAGAGLAADHGVGSNNWVVGPSKTASGRALLANDPHLGIGMPSVWFMNGLHCREVSEACPFDVAGVSFPGVPAVILGRNATIAWGATNIDPDVEDLFVETIDPANPANYLFRGESIPFDVRTETIKVAGGEDVTIEVRETGHGPILNDVDDRLADAEPLALRWSATADVDGTLESTCGSTRRRRSRSSARRWSPTARRPRTSSTRMPRATSATCSRATSRSVRTRPTSAPGHDPEATARTSGPAGPLRGAAVAAGPAVRGDRHGQQRGGRRRVSVFRRE